MRQVPVSHDNALPPSDGSGVHPTDQLDPELLALPAPPQGRRVATLAVMAAAVVAALALAFSLRADMRFSLVSGPPVSLGHAQELSLEKAPTNAYVTLSGMPTVAHAVRYRTAIGGDYRLFPLAGQRLVYVQVADNEGAMARGQFTGRLVRFGDLGSRVTPVLAHLSERAGQPVTADSLLLLADETPTDYLWTWMVALLCVAFIALDTYLIVRWFKPIPWAAQALEGLGKRER